MARRAVAIERLPFTRPLAAQVGHQQPPVQGCPLPNDSIEEPVEDHENTAGRDEGQDGWGQIGGDTKLLCDVKKAEKYEDANAREKRGRDAYPPPHIRSIDAADQRILVFQFGSPRTPEQ